MTLPQIINELKPIEACPQTQKSPLHGSRMVEAILNLASRLGCRCRQSRTQQLPSEFPQFLILPPELQSKIWHFAIPAPGPLQINIKVGDRVQRLFFWGVNPPAMLEVCRLSREVALSVYERRLQLYTPRDEPRRVLCTTPNAILNPKEHISIYTKKGLPIEFRPDSEVHSIVAWINIPLGFKIMVRPHGTVVIDHFYNWPPKENEVLCLTAVGGGPNESNKAAIERLQRSLPDRLKHKEVDCLLQNTENGVYVPEPGLQRSLGCWQ
jgi:hypothetical protein